MRGPGDHPNWFKIRSAACLSPKKVRILFVMQIELTFSVVNPVVTFMKKRFLPRRIVSLS